VRRLLSAVWAMALVVPLAVVTTVAAQAPAAALDNGLARTPPMGFNDWNAFGCSVSEKLIKETADYFVSSGMKAAGYEYVNIDDCWMTHQRDPGTGRLVPDPDKFPDGIKGTADYVHSKGLKLGIYEDAGTKTCAGYPGSLGHEQLDAQTFADWGVDYLKYDNCNNAGSDSQDSYIQRYTAMRDALKATGRPIVYSICEWGSFDPATWAGDVGNLWRTTGDIHDGYGSMVSIFHQNVDLYPHAHPGAWNDPDMLEIGNGGMTDREYRSHFSLWSEMAAPLLAGTDLREATPATMDIYLNREVIAVDQDPLGKQARPLSRADGHWVLDKPLANGDHAVVLFNETDHAATFGTTAKAVGLPHAAAYDLRDLWAHSTTETAGRIAASVPAHGTVKYRVSTASDPESNPPNVTVGLSGLKNATAGEPTTVTATVSDDGRLPAEDATVSLDVPDGWSVKPDTTAHLGTIPGGDRDSASWTVVEPAPAKPFETWTVRATAHYAWDDGAKSASASTSQQVRVTSPVQAPYKTFASTDAEFGQAGDQLAIYGDGSDIWGSHNDYGTIYRDGAEHDGTVAQVEVTSQADTSDWAKAGIMIRNDVTASDTSPGYLIVAVTPGKGYVVQWDSDGDGHLDSNSAPNDQGLGDSSYPSWLKVERTGTSYTAWYSTDGTTWNTIATVDVPSAATTQDVGTFMTSHSSGSMGEVDFTGFDVT